MKHATPARLSPALCALLAAALLAGCGARSGDGAMAESSAATYAIEDYTADSAEEAVTLDNGAGSVQSDLAPEATDETAQKIIYTADVSMETTDFDTARETLLSVVDEAGAWLSYSQLSGSAEDQNRYANYTVRVPVENYRSFLENVGTAGSVLSLHESAEDITDSYIDVQARITALESQRDRLNALADKAETTADLIEIENQLSDVQYELESYTQRLRHMDSQVSYSTVDIYLSEVATLTPTGTSFGARLADAFAGGWRGFVAAVQNIVLALVYLWPALVVAAVIIALVAAHRRRHPRKPKPKPAAPCTPAQYAPPTAAGAQPAEPEKPEESKPKYQ